MDPLNISNQLTQISELMRSIDSRVEGLENLQAEMRGDLVKLQREILRLVRTGRGSQKRNKRSEVVAKFTEHTTPIPVRGVSRSVATGGDITR